MSSIMYGPCNGFEVIIALLSSAPKLLSSLHVPWRRLSCTQVGGRMLSPAALIMHFQKGDIDEC